MTEASRQVLWNIQAGSFLDLCVIAVVVSLLAGSLIRLLCWQSGGFLRSSNRSRQPWSATLRAVLTHKGIHLGPFPRFMHRSILYGFATLGAGTVILAVDSHFRLGILRGGRYLAFSLTLDLAGLVLLTGILLAAYKRYWVRSGRLESRASDALILATLGLSVASGFLVEGLRILAASDRWGAWSPVGYLAASGASLFLTPEEARAMHAFLWYLHVTLCFLFLLLIPWTKLVHFCALPLNHRLSRPVNGRNRLLPVVNGQARGVESLAESTLESLIEMDACVQCGRCRKQCPIHLGGIPFSPESLLRSLRRLLAAASWKRPLVGLAVPAEALWSCTGCRSCEERCPIAGEHVERMVGLKRRELAGGREPAAVAARFQRGESSGAAAVRSPLVRQADPATVYLWPGCYARPGAEDGTVTSLLALLASAGVPAVLLDPPACCAGTDRLLGQEAEFTAAARANIAYLQPIAGATIVTPCPHCFNTLKNDYPSLGGVFAPRHHAEYLGKLQEVGAISPPRTGALTATFHDPCFLGRYNSDYGSSRALLAAVPGISAVEMKHSRKKAFCCGSGGGGVTTGSALANARLRLQQAKESGAELLVTACPYCREVLSEAAAERPELGMAVADVSKLLV